MLRKIFLITLTGLHIFTTGFSQRQPVTWNFNADRVTSSEWVITIKGALAPGWHIYSQHLGADGPMPTRISVSPNDDYRLVGTAEENGKAFHFYDTLYEMNITWYSNEVSFHQRVSMNRAIPEVCGIIQYMVCNNSQCIPHEHNFCVHVDTKN